MKLTDILYVFPLLILIYMIPHNSLIIKLTTLDSFFIALNFIISFLNRELKEIDIISRNASVYEKSLLDRYILYGLIQSAYTVISLFFWTFNHGWINNLLLFTVIPFVTNSILKSRYFKIIIKRKEYFIKKIIAKNFTKIIKVYSKVYLDKDVVVGYKELMPLLNDYQQTINYTYSILKTSLVLALLAKVKEYSPNFYYKMTKHIYIYKTGNMLKSFNTHNAKDLLVAMINSRKWDELLKPSIQKAIMELYYANDQQINIIQELFTKFNYKILKISTLWVVSSLFNCKWIIPIGSVIFLLYRDRDAEDIYRLINPILAVLYSFFTDNLLMISLTSELSFNILFNPITKNIYRSLIKKIIKNTKKLYFANYHNNLFFLLTIIYMVFLSSLTGSGIILIFGINMIYNLILDKNIDRTIIMIILFLTTYISGFNIYHIIFNNCILYIADPGLNILLRKINEYIVKNFSESKDKQHIQRRNSYVVIKSVPVDNITNIEDICNKKAFEMDKDKFLDEVSISSNRCNNNKILIDDNFMDNQ